MFNAPGLLANDTSGEGAGPWDMIWGNKTGMDEAEDLENWSLKSFLTCIG